ncbi:hypothetical protein HK104_003849 [Borealophlyctis nickersoniae]|nr:hypothetical protein HK104_003849 [Borealophlyctis nickersoniae]
MADTTANTAKTAPAKDAAPEDPKNTKDLIKLQVASTDNILFFKIKKHTPLKKLMETYCTRQGKDFATTRFLYDGERVDPNKTPAELEMEQNDRIDVMYEQVGGY